MIDNLKDRIQKSMSFSFKEFTGKVITKEERVNTIVSFLAMLELVKKEYSTLSKIIILKIF